MGRLFLIPLLLICGSGVTFAGEEKPLSPQAARKKVGEKITVQMKVQAAKDRLENRGEIYLDAETDFRDEKNFAVVITKTGAAKLKEAGIDDPAALQSALRQRAGIVECGLFIGLAQIALIATEKDVETLSRK